MASPLGQRIKSAPLERDCSSSQSPGRKASFSKSAGHVGQRTRALTFVTLDGRIVRYDTGPFVNAALDYQALPLSP